MTSAGFAKGAETTVVAGILSVGVLARAGYANLGGTFDVVIAIGIDDALHTFVSRLIAQKSSIAMRSRAHTNAAAATIDDGAEPAVVAGVGVVGVDAASLGAAFVSRADVVRRFLAIGVHEALDATIVGFVTGAIGRTGITASHADAAAANIGRCAEAAVVASVGVVGVDAQTGSIARVRRTDVVVVALGVAGALNATIVGFVTGLAGRTAINASHADAAGAPTDDGAEQAVVAERCIIGVDTVAQ